TLPRLTLFPYTTLFRSAQVGDLAVNRERNGHMMAAVLYGREDLKIEKVEIPAVGAEDLLVRVKVALTCGTDFKVWRQGYHARMRSEEHTSELQSRVDLV